MDMLAKWKERNGEEKMEENYDDVDRCEQKVEGEGICSMVVK